MVAHRREPMTDSDPMLLLPPDVHAELSLHPLTEAELRAHSGSPLGPAPGWYYGFTGSGLLALALHRLSGLPLVGLLVTVGGIALGDRPLELMLQTGVWSDGRVLGAAGSRPVPRHADERVIAVTAQRVREFCAEIGSPDPSDPHAAAPAHAAARILLAHMGRFPA
jgi:hypothetical protein